MGSQIKIAAGEQITALPGFAALHKALGTNELIAYLYGMKHIRVLAAVAGAKPQDGANHQRRKHSRDGETPIEEGQRSLLGQRAHENREIADGLATA
jgi:hypothetical protein